MRIDSTYEVHPKGGVFQTDEALGYRPVPGGAGYGTHGARHNDYALEKPAGKRRLLFIGDSVTERHKIIDALHGLLGDDYEYWNAGVVGYSTAQELAYYRDYLGSIAADHVVLTFHLNDFDTTPVLFPMGDEIVAVYGQLGSSHPSPWLLKNSYLYRYVWSQLLNRTRTTRNESIERDVESSLRALQALVRERDADFTVLVLPWLLPRSQWTPTQVRQHAETLQWLEELGIRHYAFLDTLDRALADGVVINEPFGDAEPGKGPLDPQHPSDAFAELMARDLLARGFRP